MGSNVGEKYCLVRCSYFVTGVGKSTLLNSLVTYMVVECDTTMLEASRLLNAMPTFLRAGNMIVMYWQPAEWAITPCLDADSGEDMLAVLESGEMRGRFHQC